MLANNFGEICIKPAALATSIAVIFLIWRFI